MLFIHGYSEHGGHFSHVLEMLHECGLTVTVGDLRGHGRSDGHRGHIQSFTQYLDDVAFIVNHLRTQQAQLPLPLFLVGHSLGGLVAARFAQQNNDAIDGIVLAAPFISLKFAVPFWKRKLAHMIADLRPTFALPSGVPSEILCHNAQWLDHISEDPLVTKRATARWFTESLKAQGQAMAEKPDRKLPVLLLLAGDDRLVCNDAARALHRSIAEDPAAVREYAGMFHSMFHESEHSQVIVDINDWIESRLRKDQMLWQSDEPNIEG